MKASEALEESYGKGPDFKHQRIEPYTGPAFPEREPPLQFLWTLGLVSGAEILPWSHTQGQGPGCYGFYCLEPTATHSSLPPYGFSQEGLGVAPRAGLLESVLALLQRTGCVPACSSHPHTGPFVHLPGQPSLLPIGLLIHTLAVTQGHSHHHCSIHSFFHST